MHTLQIEPPASSSWGRALAVAALFAALTLLLTTRNNGFPIEFHPDEWGKVDQIQTGTYNYNHPLLMLRATEQILSMTGGGTTTQQVVMAGRWGSAIANAAAVLCLVLIASRLGGGVAGVVAGALLASNHLMFELAHYFKEDTWFLFGLSVFLLALIQYGRRGGPARAALLGAALGIAASTKYTSVVLVPIAVGAVIFLGQRRRAMQIAIGLAACVAVWVFINWPLLRELMTAGDAVLGELRLALGGQRGIGRPIPHGWYFDQAYDKISPIVWALVLVYLGTLLLRRRTVPAGEWVVAAFPFAFAGLLSFFAKVSYRYLLPIAAGALVLAGLGAGALARLRWRGRAPLGRRQAGIVLAGVLAVGLIDQLPRLVEYYDGFLHGTRAQLVEAIETHVPAGARIAAENRVGLAAFDLPYEVLDAMFVADLGDLSTLRDQGTLFFAVTKRRYGPLFDEDMVAPSDDPEFIRRRDFYARLFSEGELLFEVRQGPVKYMEPHLALYRLPSAAASADAPGLGDVSTQLDRSGSNAGTPLPTH